MGTWAKPPHNTHPTGLKLDTNSGRVIRPCDGMTVSHKSALTGGKLIQVTIIDNSFTFIMKVLPLFENAT